MSAYNVVTASVQCPNCAEIAEQRIQFRFGNTWQHEYAIGDKLQWNGNDVGKAGLTKVIASGAGEECPICHTYGRPYIVIIERDVITSVEGAPEGPTHTTNGELYEVVEE